VTSIGWTARVERSTIPGIAPSRIVSLVGWVLTLAAMVAIGAVAWTALGGPMMDWESYRRGAEAVLAGRSPYAPFQLVGPYSLPLATGGHGFVYPPSGAVVLAPLTASLELWIALNAITLASGVFALVRRSGGQPLLAAAVLWLISLTPPLREGLDVGSASVLMAGILAWTLAGSRTSIIVGLAAATKLFPGAWLLWTGRTDRRATLIGGSIAMAAPVLVSVALAGPSPWLDWIVAFGNGEPLCVAATLRCTGVPIWLTYVVAAGALLVALAAPRSVAACALVVAIVAAAPDWPKHYDLLLLPPAIVATGGIWGTLRSRTAASAGPSARTETDVPGRREGPGSVRPDQAAAGVEP
jgi:hypothetical protein